MALPIFLVLTAGGVLSGMDTSAKLLARDGVPIVMIVWGRYFFHTVITFAAYAGQTRSLGFLRARSPRLQFIRAAVLFGATGFLYVALTRMQLADAASIQFLAPVLVTAMSGLVLGEKVGPRRWAAVACGFIGVLLVARPGSGVLGWTALLPLGAAVMLATYMMLTRIIRTKDDPAATTFYSTAVGAVVLTVAVPFFWHALSPMQWVLMTVMGAAGATGHFVLVKAFHSAEASLLAPFTYSHVVAAILWGLFVFEDVPSGWTLAGAGVVIGSGIYVGYRENVARRRASQS